MPKHSLAVVSKNAPPPATRAAALVLFGRDEAGKPHAASFAATESEGAQAAAAAMGLRHAPVNGEAVAKLARLLPLGRLFSSGKAFVPFVKATLYGELLAALGEKDEEQDSGDSEAEHEKLAPALYDFSAYRLPPGWGEIGPGHLVLATVGAQEGWYEALITEVKDDGGLFVLSWRDWPDEPAFLRRAHQLALLPIIATAAAV